MDLAAHEEMRAATALPPTLASARTARSFVREAIETFLPEDALNTVELLTSEIVTNAVVHANASPVVVVAGRVGAVRVAVQDPDPHLPTCQVVAETALSGRGLALVDTYAAAWGVALLPDAGKEVWFEVRE